MAEVTQQETTAKIVAAAADATAKAVFQAAQAAAQVLAKENSIFTVDFALLKADVANLKNQQTTFEIDMNKKIDALSPQFKELNDKMDVITVGRPTWAVTWVITILSSACVGLLATLLTTYFVK